MKFRKFILGRVFVTACFLIVQLGWLLLFYMKLVQYSAIVSAFFALLSMLITLYIICKDEDPGYKIGWIVMISTVPLLGGLLYLTFGNKRPSRFLRHQLDTVQKNTKNMLIQEKSVLKDLEKAYPRMAGVMRYVSENGPYPVWGESDVTYYPLGELMFEAMMGEIEKAERFIFLEYFILADGELWTRMLSVLKRKAEEGVDVRLIYDDVGSLFLLPPGYQQQLELMGIKCIAFNRFRPVLSLAMNNRDHRKILVVDGRTAFNGGMNLADEYININSPYGHWKDTGVKITGPAVWNFTKMFLDMWNAFYKEKDDYEDYCPVLPTEEHKADDMKKPYENAGYVQPFSDTPLDNEPLSENVYIDILFQAKRYVYIYTPYLAISSSMQNALQLAAKRGVDVRIMTPGIPDKKTVYKLTRSYYRDLLNSGVKIYEYTPGFVHAKSFVCDDEIGVIGTINMDYRSLYLHFECGTLMCRVPALLDLKADYLETIGKCREIEPADISSGRFNTFFTAVLRVLSPLF